MKSNYIKKRPSFKKRVIFFFLIYLPVLWFLVSPIYSLFNERKNPAFFSQSLFMLTLGIVWTYLFFKYIFPKTTYEKVSLIQKTTDFPFIFYTRTNFISTGNPFRGFLIIGGAGSGKSETIIHQLIDNAVNYKFTGLLYDFKYPVLTNHLKSKLNGTYKLYAIDFTNPLLSDRINPISPKYVINASYAREFALSLVYNLIPESVEKFDFWARSATDLLTAEIFFLSQEYPEYCSLPHVIALNFQDESILINMLKSNLQTQGMIKSIDTALTKNASNQLSGVIGTVQSALSRLNIPEIFWIMSASTFELDLNNPNNPRWLSIGNYPELSDTYSPAISLIITAALKQLNNQNRHPSIVLLDEAPTITIPNIDRIPATARSNKVSFVFCAQDISQIEKSYGKINSEVITGNLNNQFYGRLSNPRTAEHVSRMFGKELKLVKSYGQSRAGFNKSISENYSEQERTRVFSKDLLHLEPGEFAYFLVESSSPDGIEYFKRVAPLNYDYSLITPQIDLKGNFERIYDDINNLIKKYT